MPSPAAVPPASAVSLDPSIALVEHTRRQSDGAAAWSRSDHGGMPGAGPRLVTMDKVWTADELAALTPAEQDALFQASIVHDLSEVPEEFVARVRARLEQRIAQQETPRAS